MKLTRKRILVVLAGFVGVGLITIALAVVAMIVYVGSGESGTPSDKQSAIESTLRWARLSPFPSSAQQFSLTTEGNMFTRSFRASFTAPPTDIKQWLVQSPGIREASPTTPAPGVRHFEISPGDGAQHAEVTVDDTANQVSIYVSWS
jgi:hypothetical protein